MMLIVHVDPAAGAGVNGVVNEQVVPANVKSVLNKPATVSAVICRLLPPVFVMVTTLVTPVAGAGRGVGTVKVRVRIPRTVPRVPLVALVKLNVPGAAVAVPVSETGVPVPVAPV